MDKLQVTFLEGRRTQYGEAVGEIQIGDFKEEFAISTAFWEPEQYLSQWKQAFSQLSLGKPVACLVASLDDPNVGGGTAFIWVFYREDESVFCQNLLLVLDDCKPRFEPSSPLKWVLPRETVSESGEPISEWQVSFNGLSLGVGVR